jgi:hypothetical protein
MEIISPKMVKDSTTRTKAGNGSDLNNRIRECGAKRSSAPFRSHAAGYPHGAKKRKEMLWNNNSNK